MILRKAELAITRARDRIFIEILKQEPILVKLIEKKRYKYNDTAKRFAFKYKMSPETLDNFVRKIMD